MYRRSKWPLTARVPLGVAIEVMIVLMGQIDGQGVVLNRIRRDPIQRRLLRLALDRLDLNNEGLIRPEVERFVRNDNLAIEVCVDCQTGTRYFIIAGGQAPSKTLLSRKRK